jgi:predicted double-glycine peptidase
VDAEGRHNHILSQVDVSPTNAEFAMAESQLASLDSDKFFCCGPNALYMFMLLSGQSAISLEEVKLAVPLSSPQGASLLSILCAAREMGVNAEVRKYRPQDYDAVPLPAIVHIHQRGAAPWSSHYDVMYKKDAMFVYLLDGTTGQIDRIRRTKFASGAWWTGYSLTQKRSVFAFIIDECWPGLAACFLATDVVVLVMWMRRVKQCSLKQPAAKFIGVWTKCAKSLTLVFLLGFLSLASVVSAQEKEPTWIPWRCPKNQGVNALFCYLRANKVTCEYSDLVKAQAKELGTVSVSANALVHLAASSGVTLRVASLTMKELDFCGKPVITYMTSSTPNDGAFLLLLNLTDSQVYYVDGASATMQTMSREEFRRVWSGIALLPAIERSQNWIFYGLGLCVGLPLALLIRFRQT